MEYIFLITGILIGWLLDKKKTEAKSKEFKEKMKIVVRKIQRKKSIETFNV